ncbi:hypothetical protein ACSU64_19845 [Bacillaceae bacterium C204]|uniref:hypothetical protein n=1 Tax=Neobacillus sp. 204 TaxID=3383351 RepID=UPI00397C8754
MYTIITGMNGPIYHGYGRPFMGAWAQMIHGIYPHNYISFGGYHVPISPPLYPTKYILPSTHGGTFEPSFYGIFR